MDINALHELFQASAQAYGEDLKAYDLVPRGSRNGLTERNIPLAIAKQAARMGSTSLWKTFVEIPFHDERKANEAGAKPGKMNARLDMLLLDGHEVCLIECKQFYSAWQAGAEYGLSRDLQRLLEQFDCIKQLTTNRLGGIPPRRIFIAGILDCWKERHVTYLRGQTIHGRLKEMCETFNGFSVNQVQILPKTYFATQDKKVEWDGYYWVWGIFEMPVEA